MARRSFAPHMARFGAWFGVLAAVSALGCSRKESPPTGAAGSSTAAATGAAPGDGHALAAGDGRTIFLERCSVCHGKEADGAQGPALRGLLGHKIGADPNYGYTRAVRASALVWDEATLDRFLAGPGEMVPGTTMAVVTSSPADRKALIAYFSSLGAQAGGGQTAARASSDAAATPVAKPGLRTGRDAFGGYRSDAPGVRRRITVADLPAPFASESVRNNAKVVDPPAGAMPKLPPGFHATLFAKDLKNPRLLKVAPNGDLFAAESDAGQVQVLRVREGAETAERVETFANGLEDPFGVAFYPPGPSPQWVYVGEVNAVRRFPYTNGDLAARGASETVIPRLAPTTGGHNMRDLAFSKDGKRLFVAVGSASNIAEDVAKSTPEEIRALEATHGLGAMWGSEEWRADVLAFDSNGKNPRAYATGIRNCSGLTVNPKTGDVWCSTNERDKLGDDLVPDYTTRVRENAFYGWPWYYLGDHEDPRHAGERKDLLGKVTVPDVLYQPHSAPLQTTFYDGTMFPPEYRGNAFVALHGSWNRGGRTGYKVARVIVKDGIPTGEYEDFMTGFVIDDDQVWGRPVGVAVGKDGSLFVSDDGNGTIWRITYKKP